MNSFRTSTVIALALLLPLSGCAGVGGLGGLEDILGGGMGQQGAVRAEIQSVNQQQQTIQIRTEDGRTGAVRYDQNTRVVYQQREYPVTALEYGDLVLLQIVQGPGGEPYAGNITVETSVQERGGQAGAGDFQFIEGRAGQIDLQRGTFQLQTQQGRTVVVSMPYQPDQQTLDRFRRMRNGDWVALEGRFLTDTRVELHRFR